MVVRWLSILSCNTKMWETFWEISYHRLEIANPIYSQTYHQHISLGALKSRKQPSPWRYDFTIYILYTPVCTIHFHKQIRNFFKLYYQFCDMAFVHRKLIVDKSILLKYLPLIKSRSMAEFFYLPYIFK